MVAEHASVTHTSGTRKADEYETFEFGLNRAEVIVVDDNGDEVKNSEGGPGDEEDTPKK